MSIQPAEDVPYPDPDESFPPIESRVDTAEQGILLHSRKWRGADGQVEQFALILQITPGHTDYAQCEANKGDDENFRQIRRTDTWHSTVHSHQFFIDSVDQIREEHEVLRGGTHQAESRRAVHALYQKHYTELQWSPFDFTEIWKAGKP